MPTHSLTSITDNTVPIVEDILAEEKACVMNGYTYHITMAAVTDHKLSEFYDSLRRTDLVISIMEKRLKEIPGYINGRLMLHHMATNDMLSKQHVKSLVCFCDVLGTGRKPVTDRTSILDRKCRQAVITLSNTKLSLDHSRDCVETYIAELVDPVGVGRSKAHPYAPFYAPKIRSRAC